MYDLYDSGINTSVAPPATTAILIKTVAGKL